jgi:hypothetical protein
VTKDRFPGATAPGQSLVPINKDRIRFRKAPRPNGSQAMTSRDNGLKKWLHPHNIGMLLSGQGLSRSEEEGARERERKGRHAFLSIHYL